MSIPAREEMLHCLKAASPPLLVLTSHLQSSAKGVPALPGPADHLLARMIELVEMNTGGQDRGDLLCNLLVSTAHLLSAGVARWVTSLSSLIVANPSSSHLLALVPHLCQTCPEAMTRELGTLLPALLKQAYSLSWKDPPA